MSIRNVYVEIDFDETINNFRCKTEEVGEYIANLADGDNFNLIHLDVPVQGKIKYAKECKPYGFYFESDDKLLTVELNDGMYGYIEQKVDDDSQYLGVEKETINKF